VSPWGAEIVKNVKKNCNAFLVHRLAECDEIWYDDWCVAGLKGSYSCAQQLTRFQLTLTSRGPSAIAELLGLYLRIYGPGNEYQLSG